MVNNFTKMKIGTTSNCKVVWCKTILVLIEIKNFLTNGRAILLPKLVHKRFWVQSHVALVDLVIRSFSLFSPKRPNALFPQTQAPHEYNWPNYTVQPSPDQNLNTPYCFSFIYSSLFRQLRFLQPDS